MHWCAPLWHQHNYYSERKPNIRGSYLFIIRKAIIFDKLGLMWSAKKHYKT